MARIAHNTILASFDKIRDQMLEKGGKVVSRKEAAKIVEDLKKEGLGDFNKAFVTEALYAMIDAADSAKYAKVTATDFATARAFLTAKLDEIDKNPNNGISKAELETLNAKLRPIASALVLMSKVGGITKKPGPMGYQPFRMGVAHVVNLIKNADGGNKRISKKEKDTLVASLRADGRIAEALAVRNIFHIAKKQDAGKIVTHDDLDRTAAWALAQIKKRDKGGPGFSKTELTDFPPTWKAIGQVGFAIEGGAMKSAGRIRPTAKSGTAEALANKLEKMTAGLWFISEGDYPFEGYTDKLDKATPLTDDSFRALHNVPSNVVVYHYPASEFFEYYTDSSVHSGADVAKFEKLQAEMTKNLTDLSVYKIGNEDQVDVSVYLIGRDKDGALVGLKSISIET